MHLPIFPSSARESSDIGRFFLAALGGTVACIALYTIFGFILCHAHGIRFAAEMQLFLNHRLLPVIMPGDPLLTSFIHQLGSGLFFGLTLGIQCGIFGLLASIPVWYAGKNVARLGPIALMIYVVLAVVAIGSGYSKEMPGLSIVCGILYPAVYFIPWTAITNRTRTRELHLVRWAVCAVLLLLPLVLLKGQSYELIRDAMVDTPVLKELNTFYYEHTLLAADVIKPPAFRTQNAVALAQDVGIIGRRPHGSLWISSRYPCLVNGAVLTVGREPLGCPSLQIDQALSTPDKILKAPEADPNKAMRKGIGTFLTKGPALIIPVFFLSWLALLLADLSRRSLPLAGLIIVIYLLAFIPAFHHVYLRHQLFRNPEQVHVYASSPNTAQRYLALILLLSEKRQLSERLTPNDLSALAHDESAKIRLNALILADKIGDKATSYELYKTAMHDPQFNVRTKACWALGRFGGKEAFDLLWQAASNDPSWYVRDYAYNALGRIQPISAVFKE